MNDTDFVVEKISLNYRSVQVKYGVITLILFVRDDMWVTTAKHCRIEKTAFEKLIELVQREFTRAEYGADSSKVQEILPVASATSGRKVPRKKIKK